MPPPQGIYGVVGVRLILTENGDLASVDVMEKSGTNLDQSVVFATKQTYFPLPPYKSTVADRTFYIRYVYRRG
jgi:TonB family protein